MTHANAQTLLYEAQRTQKVKKVEGMGKRMESHRGNTALHDEQSARVQL